MASLINKARKPKFHLHLKICDLNNVPLISGVSVIKWHLPHSIHSEHRGRTQKCPIANHRVEYGYAKIVPLRIVVDRGGNLTECPIEFEITQEFSNPGTASGGGGAREEKITLGVVRINLSEYVEESEALLRPHAGGVRPSFSELPLEKATTHSRQRSSLSGISSLASSSTGGNMSAKTPSSQGASTIDGAEVEDGVIRRYLMQESKINSTLKISILMVQVEGERNYVAPPLKTAPVFGGIAGMLPGEPAEQLADGGDGDASAGANPMRVASFNKSRDAHELQDMYRRALAASWASQPGELAADECIEDIFSGGDGFQNYYNDGDVTPHHGSISATESSGSSGLGIIPRSASSRSVPDQARRHAHPRPGLPSREDSAGSASDGEEELDGMDTLRPRDMAKMRHHFGAHGGHGDRSTNPNAAGAAFPAFRDSRGGGGDSGLGMLGEPRHIHIQTHHERRDLGKEESVGRSRSESLASLATTAGSSERGKYGFKRPKEVEEYNVRDDLVAWSVSGAVAS